MNKLWVSLVASIILFSSCITRGQNPQNLTTTPRLMELQALVTIGGSNDLSPDFNPEIFHYNLNVQSDIDSIKVLAITNNKTRLGVVTAGKLKPIRSGTAIKVDLAVGDNRIEINLVGVNGQNTVYTIHIKRENIQSTADRFLKLNFSDPATNLTIGYRLFVPADYDPTKSYPLIFFLHGAFDMGTDNERQLHGSQGATVWAKPEEQVRHPAFVLAPQCPHDPAVTEAAFEKGRWGRWGWTSLMSSGNSAPYAIRPELKTAYDLLEKVLDTYSVDKSRVYCTGLSMGAFGAFAIALAHPNTFAALVPVAGGGDPDKLATLSKTSIWIFHANKDPGIPLSFAKSTRSALTTDSFAPKYTEYPASAYFYPNAHYSWIPAYANAEMKDWLFAQSKEN